ncbi:MAG: DmsE family decaheme c-type cytochrome [Thermodesulfobacteriota bacterium]|nr:DmsE family decaheme c-type cytochrome [Thermodesulfobacteriota bacterium]
MRKNLLILIPLLFAFLFIIHILDNAKGSTNYVGSEVCKGCHEESYSSYAKSIHAKKAIAGSPANRGGCESCHGPGAQHAEKGGGKGGDIFGFGKKVSGKEKYSKCLTCHGESKHVVMWDASKHRSADVSCDTCHSVHSTKEKNLKAKEPELCYSCHLDIKVKSNKQSRHPVKEGKIKCNDCHNSHGAFGKKAVKADSVNELCYKCHSEKRGPFMWEHAPVEENCLNCHDAHGSNHSKLLTRKMPQLCQSCHDWSRHPGTIYTSFETFRGTATSGKNRMFARSCLNCHQNVHGSNGPSTRGKRFVR